jgi:uncharacterized membrane protein YdjX (TVP38/TMEM64 family)
VTHTRLRRLLTTIWVVGAGAALYLYFFHRDRLEDALAGATGASLVAGGSLYLLMGCLRGFTLIPVTSLVLLGIVFFPPVPLFVLTLAGILVSSASVYYFAEALHVDDVLRRKHGHQMDRVQRLLERYGFAIIVGWAFFPLLPTDLICYVSGVVRVRITTVLGGIAIGEGAVCGIYIFLGDSLLRSLGLR